MESSTRDTRSRRWMGRLIRGGLIVLAVMFVGSWIAGKVSRHGRRVVMVGGKQGAEGVRVEGAATDASLGPGDLRIYNRDSTVDLILRGGQILAGLSPKTIAKVQAEMEKSSAKDTGGLGGLIAQTVKKTVASSIGAHVAYPLSNVRDIRFEDGQLVLETNDGEDTHLFGNSKVNGREQGKTFEADDAQRFIEAVRARKRQLGRER